jgi:SAM-dependent methyltransferase
MTTPLRLVFGEVADLYDRHRPSYPPALIDDIIAGSGAAAGGRAVEVGAGTGKATAMVAARGVGVLAIEPSPAMAALARRNCAAYPGVEIVESDFERWDAGGERFALLYSAQAWHWIDPALGYDRAREALAPGGLLAMFWNRPAWGRSPLRDALTAAYLAAAPDMPTDGPLHPANPAPQDEGRDWAAEVAHVGGFTGAEMRRYPWEAVYSAEEYRGLLTTLSEVAILDEGRRRTLLAGVAAAIDAHGGRLVMPMATRLCLGRAV